MNVLLIMKNNTYYYIEYNFNIDKSPDGTNHRLVGTSITSVTDLTRGYRIMQLKYKTRPSTDVSDWLNHGVQNNAAQTQNTSLHWRQWLT